MFELSSPSPPPPLVVALPLPLPPPSTPSTSFGRNLDDFNKFVLNSVAFFLTSFVFLLLLVLGAVVVVVVVTGSLEGTTSSSETIASSLPKSMADLTDEDMTMVDEQESLVVWIVVSSVCLVVYFSLLFVLVIMDEGLSSFLNPN